MRICKNIFLVCLKNTHTCRAVATMSSPSHLFTAWSNSCSSRIYRIRRIRYIHSLQECILQVTIWSWRHIGKSILHSRNNIAVTYHTLHYKVFFYCVCSSGKLFFLCNSISKLSSKWWRYQQGWITLMISSHLLMLQLRWMHLMMRW